MTTPVRDWSTTPASNGAIHFPENQNPSTVNDNARDLMAELKEWYNAITAGTMSGTVGGTADATTLTLTPAILAYATNQKFLIKALGANTITAPTINVSGLGAKTLVGSGAAALSVPSWAAGDMLLLTYNGTSFQVQGLPTAAVPQSLDRNSQTGTTYTYVSGDRAKYIVHNNASAIAGTLPQAGASFPNGWFAYVENIGAGTLTITPAVSTINLGTALVLRQYEWALIESDGTNYRTVHSGAVTGAPQARELGTRGIPQNLQNAAYGFVLTDAGGHVYHTDGTARTYTIPSNAATAFPIGTAITVVNGAGAGIVTIAITSDTLQRGDAVAGTGSRSVAANAVVTLLKVAATTWFITGAFT